MDLVSTRLLVVSWIVVATTTVKTLKTKVHAGTVNSAFDLCILCRPSRATTMTRFVASVIRRLLNYGTVEVTPVDVVDAEIVIARTQLISKVSVMARLVPGLRPPAVILQLLLLSGQVRMPRWQEVIMIITMVIITSVTYGEQRKKVNLFSDSISRTLRAVQDIDDSVLEVKMGRVTCPGSRAERS